MLSITDNNNVRKLSRLPIVEVSGALLVEWNVDFRQVNWPARPTSPHPLPLSPDIHRHTNTNFTRNPELTTNRSSV